MAAINRKMLALGVVIGLYLCLLSGAVYILEDSPKDPKISLDEIVSNEVRTLDCLKLIYQAQKQYYAVDWDQDGKNSYAEFIAHLWQTVDHNAYPVRNSLIPKKLAFAMGVSRPIHGYYYQDIHLKELQYGSKNPDKGNRYQNLPTLDLDLTKEWAITAIPAHYGQTGTLSFITGSAGKIYAIDSQNRPAESIPENLIPNGWKEVANENDIRNLHKGVQNSGSKSPDS